MSQRKVQAGGIVRTSLDNSWRTPEHVLERARVYFSGPIPFDPATGPENPTRALRFCTGGLDGPPAPAQAGLFLDNSPADTLALARACGLATPWDWPTWVNPPYGSELRAWLEKITVEAARGTEIVALLPASRWETGYFQLAWTGANALCLPRGRLAFVSAIDGQPVPGNPTASLIVGWNVDLARWALAFSPLGVCSRIEAVTHA
jgi:hypothetical protein